MMNRILKARLVTGRASAALMTRRVAPPCLVMSSCSTLYRKFTET